MASLGTFGVSQGAGSENFQSRDTTQTVENDILKDSAGRKLEVTTFGQEKKVSEKFYAGATLPDLSDAVEGQNGVDVVISEAINEVASGYATVSKERLIVPGPAGA
jgi:hypothetical protein